VQDLALPQTIPSKNQYAADANSVEAELMNLSTYASSQETLLPQAEAISLYQATGSGTASSTFTGPSGTYDMVLGYFDENDGVTARFGWGTSLAAWNLTKTWPVLDLAHRV